MKKLLSFIIMLILSFSLTGCSSEITDDIKDYTIDYNDAESFEKALNDKEDVTGKYVQFSVNEYAPKSALGFNCHAGKHLNFIFENDLDVESGDIIVIRVKEEPSKIFLLGSWKIPSDFIEIVTKNTKSESTEEVSNIKEETIVEDTKIEAPDDWTNLLERHYVDVKKAFEDAGFTNVNCVGHEIDYDEANVFEGSVVNIAIGENGEIFTFSKGDKWEKDIKIRIDYRVKPIKENSVENIPIETPQQNQSNQVSQTDNQSQNSSSNNGPTETPNVTVPSHQEQTGNLVWVPVNGGTKYHSRAGCSNMKNPMQVTKETAEQNGYTPCGRCY